MQAGIKFPVLLGKSPLTLTRKIITNPSPFHSSKEQKIEHRTKEGKKYSQNCKWDEGNKIAEFKTMFYMHEGQLNVHEKSMHANVAP